MARSGKEIEAGMRRYAAELETLVRTQQGVINQLASSILQMKTAHEELQRAYRHLAQVQVAEAHAIKLREWLAHAPANTTADRPAAKPAQP